MRWDLNIFSLMFFFLPPIENINLKLDGLIDLGPKWSYEYSLSPVRNDYGTTRQTAPLRSLAHISTNQTLSSKVHTSTVKATTASQIQDTWPKTTEASNQANYTQYIFQEYEKKKRVRYTLMADDKADVTVGKESGIENTTATGKENDPLKHDKEEIEVNTTTMKPIGRQTVQLITQSSISSTNISTTLPTLAALGEMTKNYKWMTNNSEIYNDLHKVKEDDRIKQFSAYVMKQNLQAFETLKKMIDDEKTKKKLNFLSKRYMRKFSDFVRQTRHQNIKTRLGTQKVILNTIDTSKNIIQRLVNDFMENINQHAALRHLGIEKIIQTGVNKEVDLEYQHACKQFGICRTTDGFQKFFVDIITDLIKNNDTQLRIATDSLAEALKNTDFGKVVDSKLQKKVDCFIWGIETMELDLIKPMYTMWRNAIALRNKPITVMRGVGGGLVNRTVAFIDLMDILDTKIQASEANNKLWQKIKSDLTLWTQDPKTIDIQKVVEEVIKHIENEIDEFDVDTAQDINDKLTIMLSSVRKYPNGPSTAGF